MALYTKNITFSNIKIYKKNYLQKNYMLDVTVVRKNFAKVTQLQTILHVLHIILEGIFTNKIMQIYLFIFFFK